MHTLKSIFSKNKALSAALIFIFYFVFSCILTLPSVFRLSTHIIGDGGDTIEYFSYFYSIRDNLSQGRFPYWYTPVYRYPLGVNNSISDARIFTFAGAVLSIIFNEIVIYNLLVLTALTLNGFISYLFFRKLTSSVFLGVLGGVTHGYSHWVLLSGYGSINAVLMFGFPLLGLAVLMISEGLTNEKLIFLGVAYFVIALCNTSLLMLSIISSLLIFFLTVIFYPDAWKRFAGELVHYRKSILSIGTAWIAAYILVFPFHLLQLVSPDLPTGTKIFSVPAVSVQSVLLSHPDVYSSLYTRLLVALGIILPPIDWWNSLTYVGIPTFVMLIAVLIAAHRNKKFLIFFISATVFLLAILSGILFYPSDAPDWPQWLLYPIIYLTDHYTYAIMPFWFFATGSIVLGFRVRKIHKLFIILFTALILLERINSGYPSTHVSPLRGDSYAGVVRSLPGKAVLDIPLDVFSSYNLLPFFYKKPIIGGMIHWYADTERLRNFLDQPEIARFSCNINGESWQDIVPPSADLLSSQTTDALNKSFIDILITHDIRTVIIHKKYFNREKCQLMRQQAGSLFAGRTLQPFKLAYENQDVQVYQLLPL